MSRLISLFLVMLALTSLSSCEKGSLSSKKNVKLRMKVTPALNVAQAEYGMLQTAFSRVNFTQANVNTGIETSEYSASKGENISFNVLIGAMSCRSVQIDLISDGKVSQSKTLQMGLSTCSDGPNLQLNFIVN